MGDDDHNNGASDGASGDDLSFTPGAWRSATPDGNPLFAPRGLPVQESEDLERILKLPRRPPVVPGSATSEALIEIAMQKYGRGPRQCRCAEIAPGKPCITRLLPIQAWALHEIHLVNGLIASIPVGGGKTAVGCLAPLALRNCPLCLLLVPPSLIDQIIVDYQLIAEHFHVPALVVHISRRETRKWNTGIKPVLHVLPYSQLSSPESSAWLDNLRPDAIICDEVDAVSSLSSSRALRLMRFYSQHWQTTRFCGWTGSITDKSLSEVAHLAALALRDGSPMPHDRMVTDEWGRCLDAVPNPCPPGALIRFLGPGEGIHDIRKAYRRRLAETPGFIMVEGRQEIIAPSTGAEVGFSIRERPAPPIPDIIQRALDSVRDGIRPDTMAGAQDDEIIVDPLEQAKCAREVAAGLMYRWEFPPINGQPQSRDLIRDWYAARKAWNSELRHKVLRGEVHLDSPKLCENAARRFYGEMPKDKDLPEWEAENWPVWRDIKDSVKYNTVAVRLHSFLVDDAALWAHEHRGIIWYGMVEAAIWCAERARELYGIFIPVHGGGPGAGERIVKERGDRSILASIKSHGRGRDRLQYAFAEQLMFNIPSSARVSQQAYGRLLRRGQDSAEVLTDIYLHTKELRAAFDQSIRRAEYVTDITGEEQSLLVGWQGPRNMADDDY